MDFILLQVLPSVRDYYSVNSHYFIQQLLANWSCIKPGLVSFVVMHHNVEMVVEKRIVY